MSSKSTRIAREIQTVQVMISLYCRRHHHGIGLCPECGGLQDYAVKRLEKCPFQEGKTICARCPVHCYQPAMREKIRAVMRYAGPRMSHRHPVMSLYHLIDRLRKIPVKPAAKNPK